MAAARRNLAHTICARGLMACPKMGIRAVYITPEFGWQRYYQEALLEKEPALFPERIAAAEAAIQARVAEIKSARFCTPAEQQALDDARSGLRLLTNEISLSQRAS